jgi:transmembrane sensor
MQKDFTDIEKTLASYFSGEIKAPEELRRIEEWRKNHSAEYRLCEQAWQAAERADFLGEPCAPEAWKKVSAGMEQPFRKTARNYKPFAIAASITLIAMISFFLIKNSSQQETYAIMSQTSTLAGEQASLELPDGTRVRLNASSVLRYPTEFSGSNREVYLEGEAFFDVKRNTDHPFIIHGNQAEVKVLGTAFNVRAYPDAETMEVAVKKGKVAMIPKNPDKREVLFLHEMKKGISTAQEDTWQIEEANEADFAWVDGKLIFNELPLKEVVERINLWYGARVTIDKNIEECRVSCSFQQKDLQEVLQTLSLMLHLEISSSNGRQILRGTGC